MLAKQLQLQLCVAVSATRLIHGRSKTGVCSGYLARVRAGDEVVIAIESGAISQLVQSFEGKPLILVGPGTGE